MKKLITIILITLPLFGFAQMEEFIKQQQEAFNQFKEQTEKEFTSFRDSINKEFSEKLKQNWEEFQLMAKKVQPMKPPPPTPPVVPPQEQDKPAPKPIEIPAEPAPAEPKSEEPKPTHPREEKPAPATPPTPAPNKATQSCTPWNVECEIDYPVEIKKMQLSGTSENEIAQFWNELGKTDYEYTLQAIQQAKEKRKLNDYGVMELTKTFVNKIYANKSSNEKQLCLVFLLNQLGYDTKVCRSGNILYPIVNTKQEVYAISSLNVNHNTYYFLFNPDLENGSFFTYNFNFSDNTPINFIIDKPLKLEGKTATKEIEIKKLNTKITLSYPENCIEYYRNYPQVDFSVYAKSQVSDVLKKSVKQELAPLLKGKSEYEQVDILLNLFHYGFQYKTDDDQFGYEKWNFCEETCFYPYNDCDDRAIFFAYLVRELLGLETLLVEYSEHLSTAVAFTENVDGCYFKVNSKRFVICDPTYIGAHPGQNPSQYLTQKAKFY